MGMAASQARLLSITARLSDNEQSGQQLSYAKERLADRTDQVTKEYNEALSATKLQIMTGYADGAANYTDISFSMLTSPQVVSNLGKQYIVTDPKGRVLVNPNVAEAFQASKGSLNAFLGRLGYSISDIDPSKNEAENPDVNIRNKIHEAWDKYFSAIGKEFKNTTYVNGVETDVLSHNWTFEYVNTSNNYGDGYAVISATHDVTTPEKTTTDTDEEVTIYVTTSKVISEPLNYEGTSDEQQELYNYAMALTESYYSKDTVSTLNDGSTVRYPRHKFENLSTAFDQGNSSMISYYSNLYEKMLTSGYYSYTDKLADANADPEHWLYDNDLYKGASSADTKGTPLDDPNTFEQYLKTGKLLLEVYSKTESRFVTSSISEDTCIQEVEDETKIAQAEAKYEDDLKQIQRLDSRYDMQMKKLDTEHNTLQTEYDSVKNIITKNVENSFKTFG